MKALHVIHDVDPDGLCAAAQLKIFYENSEYQRLTFWPASYKTVDKMFVEKVTPAIGKDLDTESVHVYIVDMFVNPELIKRLYEIYETEKIKSIWIDHHEHPEHRMDLARMYYTHIRHSFYHSATLLTHYHLWPTIDAGPLVQLVDAYDMWQHKGTKFEAPAHALGFIPNNVSGWAEALHDQDYFFQHLTDHGEVIYTYLEIWFNNQLQTQQKGFLELHDEHGNRFIFSLFYNIPDRFISEFGHYCNKRILTYDGMANVTISDTKKFKLSLRSDRHNINCADICRHYGGGGHKGAAGCYINTWELHQMVHEEGDN